jgi:hypothetical protein
MSIKQAKINENTERFFIDKLSDIDLLIKKFNDIFYEKNVSTIICFKGYQLIKLINTKNENYYIEIKLGSEIDEKIYIRKIKEYMQSLSSTKFSLTQIDKYKDINSNISNPQKLINTLCLDYKFQNPPLVIFQNTTSFNSDGFLNSAQYFPIENKISIYIQPPVKLITLIHEFCHYIQWTHKDFSPGHGEDLGILIEEVMGHIIDDPKYKEYL